ncbi:uncharacterized protein KRP23_4525 [Phytophthora ramorum]|uniref:uncharacterized protein n=1 Tax=Phytophthora ramorum TaxID=164328 RepID=UPI003097DB24|nr:hypothetical protein KRP23_4525 [Phytophthora ramorum]
MTQQDARRLDGVLPTALEGLQQRRETIKNLREIDKLLRDDLDESLATTSRPSSTRGCSFGSARNPARNPRYWLAKSSSAPGPGAYVASKADGLIKPKVGDPDFGRMQREYQPRELVAKCAVIESNAPDLSAMTLLKTEKAVHGEMLYGITPN